jgi:hypothetical protein
LEFNGQFLHLAEKEGSSVGEGDQPAVGSSPPLGSAGRRSEELLVDLGFFELTAFGLDEWSTSPRRLRVDGLGH